MANMTVGTITGARTTGGRKTRLRSVTFTHTAAGTAAGSATTTFKITGTLLRVVTTGGDAAWNIVLSDDTAQIWASPSINGTATSYPIYQTTAGSLTAVVDDETDFAYGVPMVNSTLTCATSNVSTVAPTIKVIWEEDEATYDA